MAWCSNDPLDLHTRVMQRSYVPPGTHWGGGGGV